jgi:hypothetical protein
MFARDLAKTRGLATINQYSKANLDSSKQSIKESFPLEHSEGTCQCRTFTNRQLQA